MHDRKPEEIHNDEKLESAQKNFPACGHGSGQGRTSPPKILDRKSTRLNTSHLVISYAVFCLKKKNKTRSPLPIVLPRTPTPRILSTRERRWWRARFAPDVWRFFAATKDFALFVFF